MLSGRRNRAIRWVDWRSPKLLFANFFANLKTFVGDGLDPAGNIEVNLIAEGEFVVRQAIRENGMLIDIFRVQDGMLVEHWDAWRPAPGHERLPGF